MFRRRKRDQADSEPEVEEIEGLDDDEADEVDEVDEPAEPAPVELERPQGPWDVDDAPEDEVTRVDLGGLLVPVPADTEVRVDVSPEGEVVAATLVQGESSMQVSAFAAPKRGGIWGEVREEIASSLEEINGAQASDGEGPFGVELHATIPTQAPEQGGYLLAPARFVGIDGPRWFLRALITGPAALDRTAAEPLEAALREVVVVRGKDAMAVRDPLPLRLPPDVLDQQGDDEDEDDDEGGLEMPVRGPEITEVR